MSKEFIYLLPDMQWKEIIKNTAPKIRDGLRTIVDESGGDCVNVFYESLLQHKYAAQFLDKKMIEDRLRVDLLLWMKSLFSVQEEDIDALCDFQRKVGAVHAKLEIPTHLVVYGLYTIKQRLFDCIVKFFPEQDDRLTAISYVSSMTDFSLKFISQSYDTDLRKKIESDEAFRMVSLGQDLNYEKEIQKTTFFDWCTHALFCLCENEVYKVTKLTESQFGLWMSHKGQALFKGTNEYSLIKDKIRQIDLLVEGMQDGSVDTMVLTADLKKNVSEFNFLINRAFHSIESIQNGLDPLTKMLNRRFLDTVIQNEISFSIANDKKFSLVMLDIDHFKNINDSRGHLVGDEVLRFVADIIMKSLRANDFVFRYGGEEFLIVLTEASSEEARKCAERIRTDVAATPIFLSDNDKVSVTLSGGVSTFDEQTRTKVIINQADQALYQAKRQGRNRIVIFK
ncbi:GGDEF domain-containing protein [Acetobacter vaccinii]|nr:GGDEF domain-containing protein [Acetobacter vaccinii]